MRVLVLVAAMSTFLLGGVATALPLPPSAEAGSLHRAQRKEPTASQMAARDRMRKCAGEWRDAKKNGTTEGARWPQYWSRCNARMKGNAA